MIASLPWSHCRCSNCLWCAIHTVEVNCGIVLLYFLAFCSFALNDMTNTFTPSVFLRSLKDIDMSSGSESDVQGPHKKKTVIHAVMVVSHTVIQMPPNLHNFSDL